MLGIGNTPSSRFARPPRPRSVTALVRAPSPTEIRHRLVVGHLLEIPVELPHGAEVRRRLDADHLVGLRAEALANRLKLSGVVRTRTDVYV